jgi:hypothetical protein
MNALAQDVHHGLTVMNEAPNYRRKVTCRDDLPLDSFSVWASSVIGGVSPKPRKFYFPIISFS